MLFRSLVLRMKASLAALHKRKFYLPRDSALKKFPWGYTISEFVDAHSFVKLESRRVRARSVPHWDRCDANTLPSFPCVRRYKRLMSIAGICDLDEKLAYVLGIRRILHSGRCDKV